MTKLFVNLSFSYSWEEFITTHPKQSIALDGYVKGPPSYSKEGPFINFDHHYGVDRFATRSTCSQVLLSIRMGLFEKFPNPNVYVNDCDEDVCLSWALLNKPEFALNTTNPILNRLVSMEDFLDCTSGLYPVQSPILLKEIFWIFAPYRDFRNTSDFAKRNPEHFQTVIESVTERIYLHLVGRGQQKELDTRFELLKEFNGWLIVKEIGTNARSALNTTKFISVGENGKYTIGKRSVFIEPDFEELFQRLNKIEPGWGGSNTIIGSPRNEKGSKLTIDELLEVINDSTRIN